MGEMVGSCHCGRVRVSIPSDSAGILACHCSDCQKLHGNFFAMFVAEKNAVHWEGEENVRWYKSSAANERAFCVECGSRLAKRPIEGARVMVSAGLFEGKLPRKVTKNLWVEGKPGWYDVPRTGQLSPEEFVGLALSEPIASPVAEYGYAMRIGSGSSRPMGVIALTWIAARDPSERERIRAHSKENAKDFREEPGFISIVTGFVGLRGFTVTAWEDEASMKRALSKHHAVAMKELMTENFVGSVWTSVWTPTRMNRLWVRCTSCGALENVNDGHEHCSKCQATMPERPAYW